MKKNGAGNHEQCKETSQNVSCQSLSNVEADDPTAKVSNEYVLVRPSSLLEGLL
jgi:hypothetical protein